MSGTKSEWISQAWELIRAQKYEEARLILSAIVEEKDSPTTLRQTVSERWEEVADAQEGLAVLAYLSGNYREVIRWALQSITRTDSFRVGAHLLAARAHANLGETDLAVSKLQMVISHSADHGISGLALAYLQELNNGRN